MANEQLEQLAKQHHDFLQVVEKHDSEIKKLGVILPETKSVLEKMNARLDELEIKAFRPIQHVSDVLMRGAIKEPEKKEAFDTYLRKGKEGVAPEVVKFLSESDATGGGFFIPPDYLNEIIKAIILISPVRQFARIRTTSSNRVKVPKRTATASAFWTAEGQPVGNTQAAYGLDEIPNHELMAVTPISLDDLEDNMFDMAAQINEEFAEQFAKGEGAAFVGGNGKGQPEGFMFNSSVLANRTITGASAGFVAPSAGVNPSDCLVTMAHQLKSAYAANAVWFLNRQTIGQVRLMKDSQGRPIWLPFAQAGLQGPNGPTVLGMPYAEMPDMQQVAANSYPIALGDWKRAYMIVDRIAISVLRDNYTLATKGQVQFIARKRVGGQVILAEAIQVLQVASV